MDLQQETGVAYVFISHNLAVVELIADEVLVMYLGRVMERAPKTALFAAPRHPYTRALLASTPKSAPFAAKRPWPARRAPPSPASCRRRWRRHQAASFAPAARMPSRPAPKPCRRWFRSVRVTRRPASASIKSSLVERAEAPTGLAAKVSACHGHGAAPAAKY
jgi:ABC-type dipeptide/oligopeptide/nickel transport system ATPase component